MKCMKLSEMEGGVWGIVVIFSAFMIQFIAFGICGSIGVYNIEFLEHFETDALEVSLISSINLGVFLGTGPLASYLMGKFSHRKVVLCGGVLSSVGIMTMPWLPSIQYMYLFYGVVSGLGGCLSYVPSHVLSGLYYDKRRGLATGIATAGSGLGITIGPLVIAYLIDEYTWRGSLFILAGLSFNVLVFGALLRPVPKMAVAVAESTGMSTISASIKDSTEQVHMPTIVISDIDNNITKEKSPVKDLVIATVGALVSPTTQLTKQTYLHKVFKHIIFNLNFMIYFINNIFWNTGLATVLAFLAEYCVQQKISKIDSAFIITINGLGNFSGCLCGGILSNIRSINSYYMFSLVNILAGVVLIILPLSVGFNIYAILSLLNGICTGMILGYLLAILADVLEADYFGDGVGIIMISNGIGAFVGPSLAGYLEADFGLGAGIILAGGSFVIGGLVILIIPFRNSCCYKRKQREDEEEKNDVKCRSSIEEVDIDFVDDASVKRESIDPNSNIVIVRKTSFYKDVDLCDEN